ncbi:MAG: cytochrome P450 [Rhodospirillaceae bacterium]|nr:cytochrome P450 [Rhodospirillaceae bacterium]MBT4486284.1 cytochrome P450 [Rhodospirillaceae bacterium]MBT5192598.1 cytochrome P450 [Rhodospirillaceae bacterium]MBT5895788.1 cytochrome P450 [Rhodospirillaceae bacterium]MBT6428543.1 cytochrome P450 [Rhodospirillaceae bacterium]
MSDLETAKAFDLSVFDKANAHDPFPIYRMLRENDPVHRNADGSYFLTRYDDVVLSFKHPGMSSDKKVNFKPKFGDGPLYTHHTTSLVFNDPPIHTRVRKLLAAAFTPRKLAELEPVVERVIDGLLDKLDAMGDFEIIEDYALALPTQVISDMLGVPDDQRHLLRGYSNLILGALDPVVSADDLAAGEGAVLEFETMLEELIAKRRENPDGSQMGEVLSALIFGEVDGERLTPVELVQNCIFLLNAGHETTANLIGNTIDMLLGAPDQLHRLQNDGDLIRTTIEESLRYLSPLQIGNRKAMEDVMFGDVMIPAGSFIHCCIAAANRDPLQFDDPEHVDISRNPNRQIAFGIGKHICMGNTLGRIEGRVAIGKFIERFPELRRNGEPQQSPRVRFRGFDKLPVSVV